jgi:hypothetical protein
MDKLDHLGWVAGLCVEAHGIKLGVRTTTDDPAILRDLEWLLPPGATRTADPTVDVLYSVVRGKSQTSGQRNYHLLYMNSTRVVRTLEWPELQERLLLGTRLLVTQSVQRHLFVAGAAVGHGDAAMLVLGLGQVARLALVHELVSAGCTYMSSDYALINNDGQAVSPFPNVIPVRRESGEAGTYRMPTELGWPVETRSLPLELLVLARHAPDARLTQRPITPGRGLLALMSEAVAARREPQAALRVFDRALEQARLVEVRFGNHADAARQLLNLVGDRSR